jgi:MoaA/NifB/PqqE/SkfB family radical SAM enzyme
MKFSKVAKMVLFSRIKDKVPLDVTHVITSRCNLRCKYCCYPSTINELTTEQSKKAISEFSDIGTIFWTFTGGEPTIREDIGKLIDFAKDCGIVYTRLLTNGVFWYKKRIDDIKNADSVVFSLDADPNINDSLRGAGSYGSVCESIRLSKEKNINFSLSTVLTKANLANDFFGLRFMFKMAVEHDCKINFQPIFPLEKQNTSLSDLQPTLDQTLKAIKLIRQFDKDFRLVKFSESTYKIWEKVLKNEKIRLKCLAGKKFCFIAPDGVVLPLPTRYDEGVSGLKHGFASAFQKMTHIHNESCYHFCFPERTSLYNLNFSTIMNYFPVLFDHRSI